jgi:hypothetical protein
VFLTNTQCVLLSDEEGKTRLQEDNDDLDYFTISIVNSRSGNRLDGNKVRGKTSKLKNSKF